MPVMVTLNTGEEKVVAAGRGYEEDDRGTLHIYDSVHATGNEIAAFAHGFWLRVEVQTEISGAPKEGKTYFDPVTETK